MAKLPPIPTEVKIGTQKFKVVTHSAKEDGMLNEGNYGYTLDNASLIVIDASISATKQRVTFVHELLHAIQMTLGGATKPGKDAEFEEWEHHFIGIYEEALLMVLRDNPEVAAYLTA
jgi:hypothetical protein